MSGKVIPFPDRRGEGTTPAEHIEMLLDAHTALMEAIMEGQTPEMDVLVIFSLDEALELVQVIEELLGPECFEDEG